MDPTLRMLPTLMKLRMLRRLPLPSRFAPVLLTVLRRGLQQVRLVAAHIISFRVALCKLSVAAREITSAAARTRKASEKGALCNA